MLPLQSYKKTMKNIYILLILSSLCVVSAAQENPFLKMAGKPYAEYYRELREIAYIDRELRDAAWAEKTAVAMREVGKVKNDKKWLLEADFFQQEYNFSRKVYLKNPTQPQMDSLTVLHIDNLQVIVSKARKINAVDIELRAMYGVWASMVHCLKNYEMSFRYGLKMDAVLSKVRAEDFPLKPFYYYEMGKLYYDFEEYEMAKLFFEKGLENPEIIDKILIFKQLWNSLGLIYRNYYKDLDKSDSCFYKIINAKPQQSEERSQYQCDSTHLTSQEEHELWTAIATGNLGTNAYLRGNYEDAIPLLVFAVENVTKNNPFNYQYAAGKAITLSEIFLKKSNLPMAKHYADRACDFLIQDKEYNINIVINSKLWKQYYQIMSRYYRSTGKDGQALLYADSTTEAHLQWEEEFNSKKLHRAEQKIQQEKLDAEVVRSKIYRQNLIAASAFAAVFLVLTLLLYRLYKQKQAAYRDLVIKTQQWAAVPVSIAKTEAEIAAKIDANIEINTEINTETDTELNIDTEIDTEFYKFIFTSLTDLLTEKNLYRNSDIKLDDIAKQMGVNRVYLSQAVNRCYGDHYNNFINEFRVKEAVILMSDKKKNHISIEGIALKAGFNDRQTFYRAFKKFTGLSPSGFRGNLGG
jgi:AraC-like DNA-binding protein/tetratricopeptide (TPR) repeat protein